MARTMTLKYSGTCKVCGKRLSRGARAVWRGKGRGVECLHHGSGEVSYITLSSGVTVSSCNCEDYPCCGH